jgi:hypothetical protein
MKIDLDQFLAQECAQEALAREIIIIDWGDSHTMSGSSGCLRSSVRDGHRPVFKVSAIVETNAAD